MSDLLAALERAEIGSDELSARVICAVAAPPGSFVKQSPLNGAWCIYDGVDTRGRDRSWEKRGWHRPDGWPVTTSLDAIVSLIEREMPGWDWSVHRHKQGAEPSLRDAWAGLRAPPKGIVSGILHEANGYTPALALCIAFVKAKEAAKQNDGESNERP